VPEDKTNAPLYTPRDHVRARVRPRFGLIARNVRMGGGSCASALAPEGSRHG
jgi:hypothetical protein